MKLDSNYSNKSIKTNNINLVINSYIHIGLHHTGSTFIQAELLPKLKKITPITFYDSNFLNDEVLYISQCSDLYYDNSCEKKVKDLLKDKKNIFISSEAFSGVRYGVYTSGYTNKFVAKRLKNIFKNPKILIGIRNQKSMIKCLYKGAVQMGYLGDFEHFFKENLKNCQLDIFKYYNFIKFYMDFFGKDNVFVYLHENFFNKDKTNELLVHMGIDPDGIEDVDFNRRFNSSYLPLTQKITFLINRFFGSKLSYGVSFGRDPRLRFYNLWRYTLSKYVDRFSNAVGYKDTELGFKGYDKILNDQFHQDNLELSKLLDSNLQDHGYI